ncbi:MAG: hypothetical protein HWE27_05610, partial [Gammaproteobacteria bacterium]|nr:hypothetical protein [Gammaproteobacteria bacterium]
FLCVRGVDENRLVRLKMSGAFLEQSLDWPFKGERRDGANNPSLTAKLKKSTSMSAFLCVRGVDENPLVRL